jgi:UDP-glucose 4-epimerase|tara:strand:+ start:2805 stop:3746 length:942 start_codon:yes stop_codon:yes gene_type:complete
MACILVTGGAGFIGAAVANKLTSQGHKVKLLDLVVNKNNPADSYVGSILDPYFVSTVMRGCDYVIHLAAALGVNWTEARRLECLYINIQGMVNILESCVKENIKKIIFTSSSEIYGNQNNVPINEDAPVNPISNYAITKLVGEEYLRAYSESYPLKYSIVRLFNVYGEHQSNKFVMTKFLNSVCDDKQPVVYGDGKQVRSFCYVSDAAKGIITTLFSQDSAGEIFNIGNDAEPISIKGLTEKIVHLSGKKHISPEFVPMENSDRTKEREVYKRIPSIEKAKKVLKYQPEVGLDEGVKRLIKHWNNRCNTCKRN